MSRSLWLRRCRVQKAAGASGPGLYRLNSRIITFSTIVRIMLRRIELTIGTKHEMRPSASSKRRSPGSRPSRSVPGICPSRNSSRPKAATPRPSAVSHFASESSSNTVSVLPRAQLVAYPHVWLHVHAYIPLAVDLDRLQRAGNCVRAALRKGHPRTGLPLLDGPGDAHRLRACPDDLPAQSGMNTQPRVVGRSARTRQEGIAPYRDERVVRFERGTHRGDQCVKAVRRRHLAHRAHGLVADPLPLKRRCHLDLERRYHVRLAPGG